MARFDPRGLRFMRQYSLIVNYQESIRHCRINFGAFTIIFKKFPILYPQTESSKKQKQEYIFPIFNSIIFILHANRSYTQKIDFPEISCIK